MHQEERSFGRTVGSIFTCIGLWWLLRHKFLPVATGFVSIGALLLFLAQLAPAALRQPLRGWTLLGDKLSIVSTTILMGVIFYVVITPVGVVRRLMGSDPLGRRARGATTWWVPYPARQQDTRHYEKMY